MGGMAMAWNLTLHGEAPQDGGDRALIADFGQTVPLLSSASVGGGWREARYVANLSVGRNWQTDDPLTTMRRRVEALGIPAADAVLLATSVDVAAYTRAEAFVSPWRVHCLVTAGVANAARAGVSVPVELRFGGTINLLLGLEGRLSPSALVAAVQTATEAKAGVLDELGICGPDGHRATGTTTDTVTVACVRAAPLSHYAGTASPVGAAIGQAVRTAMREALAPTEAQT